MTTSSYMADVQVEIAFNAGYTTAAAARVWTDVSAYVDLDENIPIVYGRGDEFATPEPNRADLTLDNRDGRFTAGKTDGAYYPNVKIGRPIRVTATPVGGVASVRFTGYVEEWPTAWDGTDAYASARISALSRSARLGLDAALRSIVSEEILASEPFAYYPLNEPEGSLTAADAVGGNSLKINEDTERGLIFGADMQLPGDPGTGIRTAAFGTGAAQTLDASLATAISTAHPATVGLEAFVTDASTVTQGPHYLMSLFGSMTLHLYFEAGTFSALLSDSIGGLWSIDGGTPTGRAVHVAAIVTTTGATTGTLTLYVNGVSVASEALTGLIAETFSSLTVGQTDSDVRVSHVAITSTVANLAERAAAGMTGFYGETAGDRIERLGRYLKVLPEEIDGGTSSQAVINMDTTGLTAMEVMRKVEAAEGGVLHDSRDNVLTLFSRAQRIRSASAFTLSASSQQIESDIVPKLDRSTLVNDITATGFDGASTRVTDAASIADYGYARQQLDVEGTAEDATAMASWKVLRFAEPRSRIPALSVDLLACPLALQTALMDADIGTRFTTAALPIQAPAPNIDFFIEGYTETIGAESYRFTFNVSPTDATQDLLFWTLNDATYGIFDARPLAY